MKPMTTIAIIPAIVLAWLVWIVIVAVCATAFVVVAGIGALGGVVAEHGRRGGGAWAADRSRDRSDSMSRRIDGILRNQAKAGRSLVFHTHASVAAMDAKCRSCRFCAKMRCPIRIAAQLPIDKDGTVIGTDMPYPPQLRYDDDGYPICSLYVHRHAEAAGFANARRATPKLFE